MQLIQQLFVKKFFTPKCALARAKNLVLEFLELGRDIAFRGFERLPPHVFDRRLVGLRLADLDVIPVDAVIAELERRDARAVFFPRFEIKQVLVGIGGNGTQIVELVVVPVFDDAAIANQHRRAVLDGAMQQRLLGPMVAQLTAQCVEQRRIERPEQGLQPR